MPERCAIIGDIAGSRVLKDWPIVFGNLEKTLVALNQEMQSDILLGFAPTSGDEFQGVLKSPAKAYDACVFIAASTHPKAYFGIGIGDVEEPVAGEKGLRGRAFYRARDAIEKCKRKKQRILIQSAEMSLMDDMSNTLLALLAAIEASWTRRQAEIVNHIRLSQGLSYEELARHYGITKQAVSQHLKAANWAEVSAAEELLRRLLRDQYSRL